MEIVLILSLHNNPCTAFCLLEFFSSSLYNALWFSVHNHSSGTWLGLLLSLLSILMLCQIGFCFHFCFWKCLQFLISSLKFLWNVFYSYLPPPNSSQIQHPFPVPQLCILFSSPTSQVRFVLSIYFWICQHG